MTSVHPGLMLVLVFLKDQSLDLCCYGYISTIYLMALKVNVNYLLMTLLFSMIHDINTSASNLNEDLEKIGN